MAQNWEMAVEFRNLSSGSRFSRAWNSSVGKNTRAELRGTLDGQEDLPTTPRPSPPFSYCMRKEASHPPSRALFFLFQQPYSEVIDVP